MNKYQEFKIQTNNIDVELLPGFIDIFWDNIMSQLPDDTVVHILVKVDFDGMIRSFSFKFSCTKDSKFKDLLFKSIQGQIGVIGDYYDVLTPTYLIFNYFILDKEDSILCLPTILLKIKEDLLATPIDILSLSSSPDLPNRYKNLFHPNGSIKLNDFSFIPLDMDILNWAKNALFFNGGTRGVISKENLVYKFNIYGKIKNIYKIFLDDIQILRVMDTNTDPSNSELNTFTRQIQKRFTKKDGTEFWAVVVKIIIIKGKVVYRDNSMVRDKFMWMNIRKRNKK